MASACSFDDKHLVERWTHSCLLDHLLFQIARRLVSRIFDITPLISPRLGVFPGDVTFSRGVSLDFEKGHNIRLSSINTTLHLGAHADAPNHYSKGGVSIEKCSLEPYLGKCLVVNASVPRATRVKREHLSQIATQGFERVLVRTETFPDPNNWNSDFASFDPSLIEEFAQGGTKLIGIDTPSIDPEDSKDLPSHAMVARHDLSVLEGIVLEGVPEGVYTLIALPLKIEGADAGPVRAILVADDGRAFA